MFKLIYVAKRNPRLSPDQFTRRWRMHGAVGMSMPVWRHVVLYVQAEPIRPVPVKGASDEHDAVACWGVREEAFAGVPLPEDADAARIMAEDERETFADLIANTSLWTTELHLKGGEPGGTTAFLFFDDAGEAREVAAAYVPDERVHRVTLNTRRDGQALGPMTNTLAHAAVVEVSTIGLPALASVLDAGAAAPFRRANRAIVTREAVLWDRRS